MSARTKGTALLAAALVVGLGACSSTDAAEDATADSTAAQRAEPVGAEPTQDS